MTKKYFFSNEKMTIIEDAFNKDQPILEIVCARWQYASRQAMLADLINQLNHYLETDYEIAIREESTSFTQKEWEIMMNDTYNKFYKEEKE